MSSTPPAPTMRIEFCPTRGYDEPAVRLADHLPQTRARAVPDGILLSPCPEWFFGVVRVSWRDDLLYAKTPEEWRFPDHSVLDALIDEGLG